MNHVERFRAVMDFEPVDRLPRIEWAAWWDQTVNRWVGEGLPTADRYEMYEHLGLDPYYQHWFGGIGPGCPTAPAHGQGIVEDAADYEAVLPHLYPPFEEALPTLASWGEKQSRGEAVVWITL